MPESLSYAVVAAIAITILVALVVAVTGPGNIVAAVLMLSVAAGIYWLIGRGPAMVVTAAEAAATIALVFAVCALADLATGYPYQAVLFLFAAGAVMRLGRAP